MYHLNYFRHINIKFKPSWKNNEQWIELGMFYTQTLKTSLHCALGGIISKATNISSNASGMVLGVAMDMGLV